MSNSTAQQLEAIAACGNVLVAAGAGTGKTSTVTARCLELILREKCSLEQILMVTFTEAAAAEMRGRIRAALREAADTTPSDSADAGWLAEQTALLDAASICTLHSFCLELVRRNFHALGLDPQFSVLDEQQTKPLQHATLDELFRGHYANLADNSAAVRELVSSYGAGRDDSIRQLVVTIHHHAQTLAAPQKWFEQQLALFGDKSLNAWRNVFTEAVAEWTAFWRDTLATSVERSANIAACQSTLAALTATAITFEKATSALEKIIAADTAEWERGTKTRIRKPIESFFNDAIFLHELAANDGAALAQDWAWSREPMLALLQLAQEFGQDFAQAKRELGGVDFADQEQFALRLLYDDTGKPTAIAQACQERFRFVFVDECQDINAAQDAILRAVSRGGSDSNRFLVGDVKQSIYRFRLANPRIFQSYQESWAEQRSQNSPGRVVSLTENFRSREAVLQFINPLFHSLMRPVIGGLTYDRNAELRFGDPIGRAQLSRATDASPCVELHIITKDVESEGSEDAGENSVGQRELPDLQTAEREARLIATRLKALKDAGHHVWNRERGGFVPVEYSDMVVLLRGIAGKSEIFAKAFHQAGVPLQAGRAGFLDALEVTDVLSLLRLLDNPLQDLPLLAVLRSPFVGLSAEELVSLRLVERRGLLWTALTKLRNATNGTPDELRQKAVAFLDQFDRWREMIRHSSLTHCVETALAETHYEALLRAGERGAERMANVRRLVDLARRFDPYQREGLFRFLQFVADQEESEVRHEPAALNHEHAVRLLTIHGSKGLEFPVVVVAGLGTKFNLRQLSNDILLDEELGLCPRVLPPESRRKFPGLAHWRAAQRERRALLGEELRLLYVAMTRARDLLILTGTASKKDEAARWREIVPLTDHALVKSLSCLDWLRLWFVNQTKPDEWTSECEGANDLLRWRFENPGDADQESLAKEGRVLEPALPPPTAAQVAVIRERLDWSYPFDNATREPAKSSVTAIRRRVADEADDEARKLFQPRRLARTDLELGTRNSELSAAAIGTAHHTFLQFVLLARTASELDLRNEATRLEREGALTTTEVAALDFKALTDFWQSDLGGRLRGLPAQVVNREMPFTARFGVNELEALAGSQRTASPSDDFVVVQGVADLAVLLPDEIWLLDFKTDRVGEGELLNKTKLYEPQLKIYALALSRIYNKPVTQCWLHFLTAQKTVPVEPPTCV